MILLKTLKGGSTVMIDFRPEQLERYSRHILLQDVGVEGQEKLLLGKILIVGAGGLGCPERRRRRRVLCGLRTLPRALGR